MTGTENVVKASEKHGATLVYISTDYVFDGKKPVGQEWEVDDQPDPQTEYGRTKRMGEELVEKHVSNFYIIRTAWVFGNYGKNFVFTMQNLAKTHKTLTVVNDQHGRPTWTRTLAEFMTYLAENRKEYGYYHLSNDAKEDTTWYDFAVEILKDKDVEVKPVDSSLSLIHIFLGFCLLVYLNFSLTRITSKQSVQIRQLSQKIALQVKEH